MRSIVTGGAGFIGSHIVDELLRLGHEVIVIDNTSATEHDNFYWNSISANYQYDITVDWQSKILPLFEGVDYVFHCAAQARIQPAIDRPVTTTQTNTLGTAIILQCAKEAGCKRVIFSSSSSIYGLSNKVPLSEDMPPDCLNHYSLSKLSAEQLCKIYGMLEGVESIALRYFNVYGPREPLRGQYAPVVGKFLKQRKNNEALTVVGDGLQRRDFTYITDVVRANILAMQSDDSYYGEVMNVGTGSNYSILEIAQSISKDVVFIPKRKGEAVETLANIGKIRTKLGWQPSVNIIDYIQQRLAVDNIK